MSWPEVPIGDVCELVNGRAFKPSDWTPDGPPIIRIQNLNDESASFNRYNGEVRERFLVDSGALLFSWSGTPGTSFGAFFWRRGPAILNQHIFNVILQPNVDANYFRYALNTHIDRIIDQAHGGVGLQHITKGKLEATCLPLPPLPEQRRIADILDKADAVRRKRREAIALTEELLRSAFLEMFGDPVTNPRGWPVRPLGELLSDIQSGWSPVCQARPALPEEWGVLKLGAVTKGRYIDAENKAIEADTIPAPEIEVKAGDVLFSRKNTYEHVAACVLVRETRPRLMLPDLLFRLIPATDVPLRPTVLWATLSHPGQRTKVQALAGGTSGSMPNIAKGRLREVLLPVPPTKLQQRFERVVHGCESLIQSAQVAEGAAHALFDSLVHRAFRGELGRA